MSPPLTIAIASAIISLAAFAVASIALWKTHFSRFSAISACGALRTRIYPITNDNESWYIPSFDLSISITNGGARPGIVLALRLSLHYPDIPIPNNRELVYADWEIDATDAREIDKHRFEWMDKLNVTDWRPFPILPKETVTKHIIFETRWDDPVIQKRVVCQLELRSDAKAKWQKVAHWELDFSPATWAAMANHGTGFMFPPEGSPATLEACEPEDLHKYTGSKEPIPKENFAARHGKLNYPRKNPET
jgi:hypothetical protein